MAEPTFKLDEKAFAEKLNKLTEVKKKNAGLANRNPFLWWTKTVAPLIEKYEAGNRTEVLFKDFLSIKEECLPINPKLEPAASK